MIERPNQLTEDHIKWIENNLYIFTHPTGVTLPVKEKVYEMYNYVYLDKKKANGCGRCWTTVKTKVYHQYLKQTQL